ncbi:hypothetical protein CIK05_01380 [Bdellovibrio sp. qaytius]|nr:hypothetical protein CIK05_01380 [Bdellovibrio sp. qaytius]
MIHRFLKNYTYLMFIIPLAGCSGSAIVDPVVDSSNQATGVIEPSTPPTIPSTSSTPTTTSFTGIFPPGSIWSTDISAATLDYQSAATINWMASNGNWGYRQLSWWPYNYLRISTEWRLLKKTASTPMVPFQKRSDYYGACDSNITAFPLPAGGGIQNVNNYSACSTNTGGDCHLVVYDEVNKKLYESYMTDYSGGKITSTCGVVWDTAKVYPADGRGDQCTSTDAAGTPASALLFTADDLAAGHIDHALRLSLPNTMIRANTFVHPATHASTAPNQYGSSPIYGARFRLKASFDISTYSPAMKVILTAMKQYGMILSDGGDMSISAASDLDTTHKFSEFNLNVDNALNGLTVDNFEVVDGGTRIPLTFNCVRNGQ